LNIFLGLPMGPFSAMPMKAAMEVLAALMGLTPLETS
jgi:hypothetical protein